jgi:hypothetical protein
MANPCGGMLCNPSYAACGATDGFGFEINWSWSHLHGSCTVDRHTSSGVGLVIGASAVD